MKKEITEGVGDSRGAIHNCKNAWQAALEYEREKSKGEYQRGYDAAVDDYPAFSEGMCDKVCDLEAKLAEAQKGVRQAAEINRLLANRNDDLNQKLSMAIGLIEEILAMPDVTHLDDHFERLEKIKR